LTKQSHFLFLPRRYNLCSVYLIFITILFCFWTSPAQAEKTLEPVTLQLKWYHQFQFAGYYAALEKGYYEDEGLDVTILERDLKFNPIDQVLDGKADFGVSNSEVLLHYLKGRDVVLLASIFQHSPLVFISKTAPLLHSPHDIKGKNVLMSRTSQDIELRAMLKTEGIKLKDIALIDRYAIPEDYFDPNIDVIAAYITNEPFFLKENKTPYSVIYPSTYGINFYGDTLFTSLKQTKNNPERVRKFLRASLKGWKYALNNPQELIEIIINKFGSIKTKEHLEFEAEEINKLIRPDLVKIGHSNPQRWEQIAENFKKLDNAVQKKKLSNFFFDPATGSLLIKKRTIIYLSSLFCLLLLILLFTIYLTQKLKKEVISRKKVKKNY